MKNHIIFMTLLCLPYFSNSTENQEPYPVSPIGMEGVINRTIPNVAIIVDNSDTMEKAIRKKHGNVIGGTRFPKNPRRIDVVKTALLKIIDEMHDSFNISLAVINDEARDLHWRPANNTSESSDGYIYADYKGISGIDEKNRYDVLPFSGKKRQRSPGTSYRQEKKRKKGDTPLGFNDHFSAQYVRVPMNETFLNGQRETGGIGDLAYDIIYKPLYNGGKTPHKRYARTLLVPFHDVYSQSYKPSVHRSQLDLATKTIALSTSYLQYTYPNLMEYMASKIRYRCEESYFIILTDGNTITNSYNRKAAQKYAFSHPRSSFKKDNDGFYFNGSDFPEQYIKSFGIGIGTNPSKFKRFERYGKGRSVTANDADDILDLLKEYLESMRPTNTYTLTSPSSSYLVSVDDEGNKDSSQLWAMIETSTKDWTSNLYFQHSYNANERLLAKYIAGKATILASTPRGLLEISKQSEASQLSADDLGLSSDLNVTDYVSWLIGDIKYANPMDYEDKDIPENITLSSGDSDYPDFRIRTIDPNGEKRFLGDVLSSSVEMIGKIDQKIKSAEYLIVGSNDGMLKIFHANPDYMKYLGEQENCDEDDDDDGKIVCSAPEKIYDTDPYIYSFGYLPGNAKKQNGTTILTTLKTRAEKNYGATLNHQYTVNGQLTYRTTDQGQTFLVAGLGQGGKGAFALNITGNSHVTGQPIGLDDQPTKWKQSVPLWDTNDQSFGGAYDGSQNLGYLMGAPVVGRMAIKRSNNIPDLSDDVRYIAAIPVGEHGESIQGPSLNIYDALGIKVALTQTSWQDQLPGRLIKTITYHDEKNLLLYENSLSPVTLVDLDFDGVVDVGYAGDRNGNLYRFDFRGDTPEDWTVDLIFKGTPQQPIIHAPSISRFGGKNIIVFGTGSYLYEADFGPTKPTVGQSIYGIYENADFTEYKTEPLTNDSKFLVQQIVKSPVSDERSVTNFGDDQKEKYEGWRLDLEKESNESLAGKIVVYNGSIFFQTYIYHDVDLPTSSLMCYKNLNNANTWLFQLNAKTGGHLTHQETHINEFYDGGIMRHTQRSNKINPAIKLITASTSSSITKDGEMQSGNDRDFALNPEQSKNGSFKGKTDQEYLMNDECNTILSNGLTLSCQKYVKKKLVPRRISIRKIF